MTRTTERLQLPALRVRQDDHFIYSFAVDGKLVDRFAGVSRLRRNSGREVLGYQRTEMVRHIDEIRRYLESAAPMIPNAIVIAFDERVRFVPQGMSSIPYAELGELRIPLTVRDAEPPGWIVDGQQRIAAIRDARIDAFPVCVTGFITSDVKLHREQFILVNATKPLPKGLLYELLPVTGGQLPGRLEQRRFPAYLMDRLNSDSSSPFHRLIRTRTSPEGIVSDISILRMLGHSLQAGVLFQYRDRSTGRGDVERMMATLVNFWSSVRQVFPKGWGVPPQKSRLMHGVGVIVMGLMMDTISDRYRRAATQQEYERDLRLLEDRCAWTEDAIRSGE